jgi:hypothetical protein
MYRRKTPRKTKSDVACVALILSAAAILATPSAGAMTRSGGTAAWPGGALGHPGWGRDGWGHRSRWGYGGRGHGGYTWWGSGYDFGDSCWQVRPIYSISGAWLGNRRVNVCH